MSKQTEMRSREFTAILEEVVGGGAPADLAQRVSERLRNMPRRRGPSYLLAAAVLLGGVGVVFATAKQQAGDERFEGAAPAVAQDPMQQDPKSVSLQIQLVEANSKTEAGSERKVAWRVGSSKIASLEALGKELHRIASDPESQREHVLAGGAKRRELMPLIVRPAPGVKWNDVLAATDAAMAAGFGEIDWEQFDMAAIVFKWVASTPAEERELPLPKVVFQAPDDAPNKLRPTINVYRDGSIAHDGDPLFATVAGQPAELERLRARLRELRTRLLSAGEVTLQGRKTLNVPLLIRAHRGVEWSHVQRLLQIAHEPEIGFRKIEIAVASSGQGAKVDRAELVK